MKIAIATVVVLIVAFVLFRRPSTPEAAFNDTANQELLDQGQEANEAPEARVEDPSGVDLPALHQKYLTPEEQQVYRALTLRVSEVKEELEAGSKEAEAETLKLTEEIARWDAWVTERKYQSGDF